MKLKAWLRKNGGGVISRGVTSLSQSTGLSERAIRSYMHGAKRPPLLAAVIIATETGGAVWYDDMLSARDAATLKAWMEDVR